MAAPGRTDASGVAVLKDCQEPALGRSGRRHGDTTATNAAADDDDVQRASIHTFIAWAKACLRA